MKTPLFLHGSGRGHPRKERGVTIVLIALAMIGIMAMAALSIDVVTLYLARGESQRAADAAALAAARVLSMSGTTGNPNNDPINTGNAWQQACTLATQVAQAVAAQNSVGGASVTAVVKYTNNSDQVGCAGVDGPFGVNPLVQVKVQRTDMPLFFGRIFGSRTASVSATATAEAFNPSNSNSASVTNNSAAGPVIPVQPRCVKPWYVPNFDPAGGNLISPVNGDIQHKGIIVDALGTGTIGEKFTLVAGCNPTIPGNCQLLHAPTSNSGLGPLPNLEYIPGAPGNAVAVPSSAAGPFQEAVAGCDQATVYQCGVKVANQVDLTANPGGPSGDTSAATQLLIHQGGEDTLDILSTYPFPIKAGSGNIWGLPQDTLVTNSSSIVTLPIYDQTTTVANSAITSVTVMGFLQVFINHVNLGDGSLDVTVLNVAGCGDGNATVGGAVSGSSPVPVRLIQSP